MIAVEHERAYAITPEEFKVLLTDRAAGVHHPLEFYGCEVGGVVGDVSDLGPAEAAVMLRLLAAEAERLRGAPSGSAPHVGAQNIMSMIEEECAGLEAPSWVAA